MNSNIEKQLGSGKENNAFLIASAKAGGSKDLHGEMVDLTKSETTAFRKSQRLQRTPPPNVNGGRTTQEEEEGAFGRSSISRRTPTPASPAANAVQIWEANRDSNSTPTAEGYTSPKEAYIGNMRKGEEAQLNLCRKIIQKMKEATKTQPNISKVVKQGLAELEEAMEVIVSHRENWKTVERQMQNAAMQKTSLNAATSVGIPTQGPMNKEVNSETPGGSKRNASSPAESEITKRVKDGNEKEPWILMERKKPRNIWRPGKWPDTVEEATPNQGVVKKTRKKRKRKRKSLEARPEALLIKVGEGKSYAEILGTIRKDVNPEASNAEIRSVRRTRTGDVLLELGPKTKDKATLREAMINVLGDTATVRCLEPRITLEIRDLDCLTTENEVREAVVRALNNYTGDFKISLSKANSREQRSAYIEIAAREGFELIKTGRIKIGWVSCKVVRRAIVTRCYACFGFGHQQRDCKGPDRTNLGVICFKCGGKGHMQKDCKAEPKCFACEDLGMPPEQIKHVRGTGACQAYREALDKAKRKIER